MGSNKIGQFFTPDYIAKFMVRNAKAYYFKSHLSQNPKEVKILEPSAGQGVFLDVLKEEGFIDITSYELDITLKDYLLDRFPNIKFHFDNFLGSDIEDKFDIIVGNPPYLGQNYNAEIFQDLVNRFPICKKYFVGNMDLFYFFIHLGILKLKMGGFISFITTKYWISKSEKTGIKHLKPHIIQDCYLVQFIDLSNLHLFKDALGQHNCIFVLRKKTDEEKNKRIDFPIEIIQIAKKRDLNISDETYNQLVFEQILTEKNSPLFKKYVSALTNNDLVLRDNWYLLYPREINDIILHIEELCKKERKIQVLGDLFSIRNGLILIKDEIFILKENQDIFFNEEGIQIKIGEHLTRLNSFEVNRIKKIYKSRAIKRFGYNPKDLEGFLIYFNKNMKALDQTIVIKYPNLIRYLNQYKEELISILKNAKESPSNLYYPRRGSHIKQIGEKNLVDLENFYDGSPKIFFKFISQDNIFGFCSEEYYATSDTYFLWAKNNVNYEPYFTLAYLNSKIVNFIYKARNLALKRSKTKIERGIPIPILNDSLTEENRLIVNIIKKLSRWIVSKVISKDLSSKENLSEELGALRSMDSIDRNEFEQALRCNNIEYFQNIIDQLFYQFFNIDGKQIDYLINKYYNF